MQRLVRRRLAAPVLGIILLGALLAGAVNAGPAKATTDGTLAWPHFLKVHVESRRLDTRVIVDAGWVGTRWMSQPAVETGDYLVRVDQSGFVRSLDAKLAFTKTPGVDGAGLTVRVQSPGMDGVDSFPFVPGAKLQAQSPYLASDTGNRVDDVQPYVVNFTAPIDFAIYVGAQCRPNQYLQVAPE